jgi:uncharacterized flavoprotein (TIGR03862 family)
MKADRRHRTMLQDRTAAKIAVVGAGPAGLIAAETLAAAGHRVTVYDHMASAGRKFLMAGRGGLNLTHSEPFDAFLARYGSAAERLRPAIAAFPPDALRAWCEGLGQTTFVGTSGRVFPHAMKTSPLLRAWLIRLAALGVTLAMRHRWSGFDDDRRLVFATPAGDIAVAADAAVLGLGGASWPRLGSDAGWVDILERAGVRVAPLEPANCGFVVAWSEIMRARFAGAPLKSIALSFADKRVRGEATITATGVEGGAVYALSGPLREAIARDGTATLEVDLRPDLGDETLRVRLARPRGKQSRTTFLRKAAGLAPPAIALVNEVLARRAEAPDAAALAALIKALPLTLIGTAPIARAISSAGGIAFDEIDATFMLRKKPGVFVAGEMLDWEAPTGGYLLTACFATGVAAAKGAMKWLDEGSRCK